MEFNFILKWWRDASIEAEKVVERKFRHGI